MRAAKAESSHTRRLSGTELGELAFDVGPDARTIAVLLQLNGEAPSEEALGEILGARLGVAPRWSCRVARRGRGRRPVWQPVPGFDPRTRIGTVAWDGGHDGDLDGDRALLARLAEVAREPWDAELPPWRLTRITGVPGGRDAVVLSLHHVLADGPGVLTAASALLGMSPAPSEPVPGSDRADRSGSARTGASSQRRRPGVARLRASGRTIGRAVLEVAAGVGPGARRTSLRTPLQSGFTLAVVELELDAVRSAARRNGATINDVLLVAAARSLAELLRRRGESTDRIVVSVPVTRPRQGEADRRVRTGIIRVPVPVGQEAASETLARTALITARRRRFASGESSVLLAQVFRFFAALGVYRWVLGRQRVIDTVVTNLRGPSELLVLAGVPVVEVVPVAPAVGNVPIFFVALSYAGRLVVCVRADDQVRHELPAAVASFRETVGEVMRG